MPPALLAAHYKDRIKGAKSIIGDPCKRKPCEGMQGGEQRDIERADATVRGGLARRETCADATVCAGTCGDIEQMTNNVRCGRACKTWIYLETKRNGHDGRAGVARLRRQTSREARRWSGR